MRLAPLVAFGALAACSGLDVTSEDRLYGEFRGVYSVGWEWKSFLPCGSTDLPWYMTGNLAPILALRQPSDSAWDGWHGSLEWRGERWLEDVGGGIKQYYMRIDTVLAVTRESSPRCP